MQILIPGTLMSVILFTSQVCWSQHAHLPAGAESTTEGSKLFFVNGDSFATNSGTALYLDGGHPLYPGLYQRPSPFTALPATVTTGGPVAFAAALGAYLELQVVSVSGPADGVFGVWEENEEANTSALKFSVVAGEEAGTQKFSLTEGVRTPAHDPFGHSHAWRLTVSKPGLYTVGFRILDTSTAGANRGPIHSPSDVFYMYFQAGLTIAWFVRTDNVVSVTFAGQEFHTYYLERSSTLDLSSWTEVAARLGSGSEGRTLLLTLADETAPPQPAFYRIQCASECHQVGGN